MLRLHP
jgi:death-on-curing protein